MKKYLPVGSLLFMGVLSIYYYYIGYPFHGESREFFGIYLVLTVLFFGIAMLLRTQFTEKTSYITLSSLLGVFAFQLFFVSIFFFGISGQSLGLGIFLFLKIIFFLTCIGFLWLIFWAVGRKIVSYTPVESIEDRRVVHLLSVGLGFGVGIFGIFCLLALGVYSLTSLLVLLGLYIGVGFHFIALFFKDFRTPLKSYEHDMSPKASFSEKYNLSRCIDEIHYIVITFLLSVNLISVYRPFPIGWDDLGAYMNYPKLLSEGGEFIAIGKMYMWEVAFGANLA